MNPTVTQGTNFKDTAGRVGVVQYDPNTGQRLSAGQTVNSPTAINQMSPAVITSKVATKDLNNIQTQYADITSGINNQATANANTKAIADTAAATKAVSQSEADLARAKLAIDQKTADAKMAAVGGSPVVETVPISGQTVTNPTTGTLTTINAIAQNPDGSYSVTFADTPNTQRIEAGSIGNLTSSTGKVDSTEMALQKAQADYQARAKQVEDTISNIQNGTVPLNEGQIAQIEGLKQQFQQLIDQQVLTNTGAQGTANIRGYQTGAAEYDPSFAVKTIGSIITAGTNKIVDLNVKMASAVAKLTEGFKTNNINAIKDAYSVYQDASAKRTAALQKTIDDTQKVIKEAQEAKLKAEKTYYDQVTKPIDDIAKDVLEKTGDSELASQIINSGDISTAIKLAGDSLQNATGIIGEYLFYKKDAMNNGLIPVSFDTYQNMDTNRKVKISSGTGSGSSVKNGVVSDVPLAKVTNAEITKLNTALQGKDNIKSLIDQYKENIRKYGTQVVFGQGEKERKALQTNLLLEMKTLAQTGALDQGTIDVLAGTIPNSQFFTTELAQIKALDTLLSTIETKTRNYVNSYEGTTAESDPRTRRAFEQTTANSIIKSEEQAKNEINVIYPSLAPEMKSALKTLYEAEYTDAQVYEYLKSRGIIQ